MVKPELGSKRLCLTCSTKFFDMARSPIICPKCSAVFVVIAPLASRSSRAPVAAKDDIEDDKPDAETVSLEEADAEETGESIPDVDDVEVADDAVSDDTFLEEEEEDAGDVSALIDSDIEPDEET